METALYNDGEIGFAKKSDGWLRSFPKVVEWNKGRYLVEDKKEKAPSLPVEFYAHQFLEVNPRDEDSLLEFASRWGIPSHPCRYNGIVGYNGWSNRHGWGFDCRDSRLTAGIPYGHVETCEERRMLAGIVETNTANGLGMKPASWGFDVPAEKTTIYEYCCSPMREADSGTEWGDIVSITEAASVIESSQRVIRSMLAWVKHRLLGENYEYDWWRCDDETMSHYAAWRFANCAATKDILPIDSNPLMDGNIIAAVFDQLQVTLLSPEPWKICPECGTPFKRKQNSPGAESKSKRPNPRARYCCEKCRNTNGNRRKSERIDHGI